MHDQQNRNVGSNQINVIIQSDAFACASGVRKFLVSEFQVLTLVRSHARPQLPLIFKTSGPVRLNTAAPTDLVLCCAHKSDNDRFFVIRSTITQQCDMPHDRKQDKMQKLTVSLVKYMYIVSNNKKRRQHLLSSLYFPKNNSE